jgi:hypothetical protein
MSVTLIKLIRKDLDESVIFFLPEGILVLLIALLRARRRRCSPLPPSVEEVTKEYDRVGA